MNSGVIGLGSASALNEMGADTVAGVCLRRDPDVNVGDNVTTATVTGTSTRTGLRKTRLREETGDVVVVANRDVGTTWTRKSNSTASDPAS